MCRRLYVVGACIWLVVWFRCFGCWRFGDYKGRILHRVALLGFVLYLCVGSVLVDMCGAGAICQCMFQYRWCVCVNDKNLIHIIIIIIALCCFVFVCFVLFYFILFVATKFLLISHNISVVTE